MWFWHCGFVWPLRSWRREATSIDLQVSWTRLYVKCIASLFCPWHGHAYHAIVDLITGENEGALGFAQSYAFHLGLLLNSHGKPASKILLASSRFGISELGLFPGLGF